MRGRWAPAGREACPRGGEKEPTNRHRAILDLKIQRDKLHKYQRRITLLTNRETEIAREMLARGDKKRALLALRRKKYQESLLSKTDAQLEQLEKLTTSVEFALIQKDVVFGLQQGTKVLQEIHREMGGLAHVEKLMGETADAIAYQNVRRSVTPRRIPFLSIPNPPQEVSDMLGTRMSNADEDEVEDELAALEAELAPAQVTKPDRIALPDAPDTQLAPPEAVAEDDEVVAEQPQGTARQLVPA